MKPRRGLSEIVASMVVLIIVSVLGVMLYNLSLSNINNQENNLLSQVQQNEVVAQAKFEVVAVNKSDNNEVKVYLYNYGQVDVKISDIYLDFGTFITHPTFNLSEDLTVNNGLLVTSQLSYLTTDYQPGVVKYTIVSDKGVSIEYSVS
jgi:hypothetical protein